MFVVTHEQNCRNSKVHTIAGLSFNNWTVAKISMLSNYFQRDKVGDAHFFLDT